MQRIGSLAVSRLCQRDLIGILMFHGVMDTEDNPSWQPLRPFLSRRKLDRYLRVLSKRYQFVSLAEAVEMLEGRAPIRPHSLALTFDDGYRNNITHALPILRRYHAPATFFVPTGFVDHPRPFWFDRLDYAVQHARCRNPELRVGELLVRLDRSSRETLRRSFIHFIRAAQKQGLPDHGFVEKMDDLAAEFEEQSGRALADVGENDDWTAIMTWDQINALDPGEVTIGSHTVDHVRLGQVCKSIAKAQMVSSRARIEEKTGRPCLAVAYPNGSIGGETGTLAREAGYGCAVTTEVGLNARGDDVMYVRRIGVPVDMTGPGLLAWITNLPGLLGPLKGWRDKR